MKTTPTIIAAALLLASVSATAYEADVNTFEKMNSSSLDYTASDFEVNTLQLQLENDAFATVDDRTNANDRSGQLRVANAEVAYYERHQSDM